VTPTGRGTYAGEAHSGGVQHRLAVAHDRRAAEAIEFYKRAFGATERSRMPMPDGKIAHAERGIGEDAIDAGATVTMPVDDQFWGDRFGTVSDPFDTTGGSRPTRKTSRRRRSPSAAAKRWRARAAIAAGGPPVDAGRAVRRTENPRRGTWRIIAVR
jgi:hypothetical protein